MYNYFILSVVLLLIASQFLVQPATAQQGKSLKKDWAELKKSFHPDKCFIMPFSDSTNEDLQAFVFEVTGVKDVTGARLSLRDQKVIVTVDTKQSMVSVWNKLPKEMRTRYKVSERTPNGFIMTDSYQTRSEQSTSTSTGNRNVLQQ